MIFFKKKTPSDRPNYKEKLLKRGPNIRHWYNKSKKNENEKKKEKETVVLGYLCFCHCLCSAYILYIFQTMYKRLDHKDLKKPLLVPPSSENKTSRFSKDRHIQKTIDFEILTFSFLLLSHQALELNYYYCFCYHVSHGFCIRQLVLFLAMVPARAFHDRSGTVAYMAKAMVAV